MSKVPLTNPVLTAVIGLIGLVVSFFCVKALVAPDLRAEGLTKGMDQPLVIVYCGLIAGLTTSIGCAAIYLRKRWGYRCASVGMFVFAAGLVYRFMTAKSSPIDLVWAVGYFGMAMHFWITGRTPRLVRRAVPRSPAPPRGP